MTRFDLLMLVDDLSSDAENIRQQGDGSAASLPIRISERACHWPHQPANKPP